MKVFQKIKLFFKRLELVTERSVWNPSEAEANVGMIHKEMVRRRIVYRENVK